MSERKDKKKVIGEPMTDEQIRFFLNDSAEPGVEQDFHLLQRAYRSLRPHDFERFIALFCETGHSLQATDPQGRTLAQIIAGHAQSGEYLDILRRHGA